MRRAIAMIELIFALVVMGIVLLSAPKLIETATQSSYTGLQQETIAASSAYLTQILGQNWDENNSDPAIGAPVLSTDVWACTLPGVTAPSGRTCQGNDNNFYSASAIGQDGIALDPNGKDDIDDFNNNTTVLSIYAGESNSVQDGNYIDTDITLHVTVGYGNDINTIPDSNSKVYASNLFSSISPQTSSIKLISLKTTSSSNVTELSNKEILLSAFVCNIGAPVEILDNIP